jgi:hypothetical protein
MDINESRYLLMSEESYPARRREWAEISALARSQRILARSEIVETIFQKRGHSIFVSAGEHGIWQDVLGSGISCRWTPRGLDFGRSSRHRTARSARNGWNSLRREEEQRSRWPRSKLRASQRASPVHPTDTSSNSSPAAYECYGRLPARHCGRGSNCLCWAQHPACSLGPYEGASLPCSVGSSRCSTKAQTELGIVKYANTRHSPSHLPRVKTSTANVLRRSSPQSLSAVRLFAISPSGGGRYARFFSVGGNSTNQLSDLPDYNASL